MRRPRRLAWSLAALAVAWLAVAAGTRIAYADRVLPGTRVAGLPLGGADREAVLRRVRAHARRPIVVRAPGIGALAVSAEEAGLVLDPVAAAAAALDAGRDGALGLVAAPVRWLTPADVELAGTLDAGRVRRTASLAARRFGRRPFDGAVRIDPGTLEASVERPRDGRSVDRARLARRVAAALAAGGDEVEAPLRRVRAAPGAAVREVADDAERYVRRPVALRGAGRSVELAPVVVAGLLRLEAGAEDRSVRLGSDPAAVGATLRDLAPRFGRPAVEPRFRAEGSLPRLSDKGDAEWRQRRVRIVRAPGRTGRTLDVEATATGLRTAIRAGRHRARAVVGPAEPATGPAAARRVRHLIGTFTTPFVAGQPRVQNIRRIARAIDGAVVQPGQQFSLNAVAGPRTRDRGYVPAPTIADGELVDSVGGGVSQVATTLYNAAFFAGLRLDAAQPHSFSIDRYPPGREATLVFGSIDLRWTNDTAAPVVVRATAGPSSVTVDLLGDNGGRRVAAEVGERREAEDGAFTIEVVRVVRRPGGGVERSARTTTYDAPPDD